MVRIWKQVKSILKPFFRISLWKYSPFGRIEENKSCNPYAVFEVSGKSPEKFNEIIYGKIKKTDKLSQNTYFHKFTRKKKKKKERAFNPKKKFKEFSRITRLRKMDYVLNMLARVSDIAVKYSEVKKFDNGRKYIEEAK